VSTAIRGKESEEGWKAVKVGEKWGKRGENSWLNVPNLDRYKTSKHTKKIALRRQSGSVFCRDIWTNLRTREQELEVF
jgi:hypothetical protein